MTLTRPDFKLSSPNPNRARTTDAEWWLWLRLHELEPKTQLGGIFAAKKGFHSHGQWNLDNHPGDYSIRDAINKTGPWWKSKSSALDWTFPTAQAGNYALIDKYTSRLVASALSKTDPRLDMILFEFYGQADSDRQVEGYDEYHERSVTSDSSHLWHIHLSFRRSDCGDYWGMWALLTVLMGWSVAKWRASLPKPPVPIPAPPAPKPTPGGKLPIHANGSRELSLKTPNMTGTDVLFVQKWVGPKAGAADGAFGPTTKAGVIWYQRMRSIPADGIIGPRTWAAMGVR